MSSQTEPRIPPPKTWNKHVRSSGLHVISQARFAAAYTRGWGADSTVGGQIGSAFGRKWDPADLPSDCPLLCEKFEFEE